MSFLRGSLLSLAPGGFHRVAYFDWGSPGSDHVVVCVHGLARNSRDFDFLARDLAQRCRVVCMDVAGRGESEWLADKGDYRFSTYLADAAALIARITTPVAAPFFGTFRGRRNARLGPGRIDWVGTSMGGLIGMLLAAKPNSPIRRLVLNDVGAFIPWSALFRLKGYVGGGRSFRSIAEVETYLREVCAQFGPLADEHWRHLAEHSVHPVSPEEYRLRYDPGIGETLRGHADPEFPLGPNIFAGIDLWSIWAEIRCPVLVLRGAESDVLPAGTLAEMRQLKPDLEVVEFTGVGHAPALMSAEQIDAVSRFLLSA
ncbi:MAG: alpha/beta hydrolase [Betaproteobacteria bacterium]|nr:alpha/beta hydrolase [Betaproteobacteria bacterium]